MGSRGKNTFSVITIVIVILDIGISWLNVHEIYGEIQEHQNGLAEMKQIRSQGQSQGQGQGQNNGQGQNTNAGQSNKPQTNKLPTTIYPTTTEDKIPPGQNNGQGQGKNKSQGQPPKSQAQSQLNFKVVVANTEPETETTCQKPELYWTFILVFESLGTAFALLEIYYVIKEMQKDKQLQQEGFRRAFVLVVLIYVFSVFPTTILEIIYRDECVCNGLYVQDQDDLKHWRREAAHARRDAKRDARELSNGLLDGISVLLLQILVFLPEVYAMLRKGCDVCNSVVDCCKMAEPEVDNSENDNSAEEGGLRKGRSLCFLVSLILSMTFVALFLTEIIYIFCIPLV